jgi:hypothetical protein
MFAFVVWLLSVGMLTGHLPSAGVVTPDTGDWHLLAELVYPEDPADPLTSVQQVLPLPDLSIAVVDAATEYVLLIDSAGRHRGRIGGRGDGPGEFRRVGRIGHFDGHVWVHDPALRRLTVFSLASLEVTAVYGPTDLPPNVRQVVMFDGSTVAAAASTDPTLSDLELLWLGVEGAESLARIALSWDRTIAVALPDNGQVALRNPYARGDIVAASVDTLIAVVAQPMPSEGRGEVVVTVLTGSGTELWTRSLPYVPEPVSNASVDEWLAQLDVVDHLARAGILSPARTRERIRNELGELKFMPAVAQSGTGVTATSVLVLRQDDCEV